MPGERTVCPHGIRGPWECKDCLYADEQPGKVAGVEYGSARRGGKEAAMHGGVRAQAENPAATIAVATIPHPGGAGEGTAWEVRIANARMRSISAKLALNFNELLAKAVDRIHDLAFRCDRAGWPVRDAAAPEED